MFGWFVQIQTRLDPNKVNWNASKTISLPLWANLFSSMVMFAPILCSCPCKPVPSSVILDNENHWWVVSITHRLNVWFRQTLSSPWGWFFIVLNWFITLFMINLAGCLIFYRESQTSMSISFESEGPGQCTRGNRETTPLILYDSYDMKA